MCELRLPLLSWIGLSDNKSLVWVEGDAEALSFDDNSMDGYTIAFGIRNVTHIEKALAEAYRLYKYCTPSSVPWSCWFQWVMHKSYKTLQLSQGTKTGRKILVPWAQPCWHSDLQRCVSFVDDYTFALESKVHKFFLFFLVSLIVPLCYLFCRYDLYSFKVIPNLGELIAGDRDSYQYLVESVRRFPPQVRNIQRFDLLEWFGRFR